MSDRRAGPSFHVWMPLHCRAAFNCIEASRPALCCFLSMFLLITPLFSSHGPVPLTQSRGSGQEAAEVAKCHPGSFQASPTALQFPGPAGGHLEPVQTSHLEGVHSYQWGAPSCFLSCALEKTLPNFSLLFGPSFLQAEGTIWRGQGHILVFGNLHRRRSPER